MKLDEIRTKKLVTFVKQEPRTVQDIARHLEVSWPTAESYVQKIGKSTGQVSMKVFRGGTRGALKIAYWNYEARAEPDAAKEALYRRILTGRTKYDFDPFDIYQHVHLSRKNVHTEPMNAVSKQWLDAFIRTTKDELLSFSGNLSWMRMAAVQEALRCVLESGCSVHILARVNLATLPNYALLAPLLKRFPDRFSIRHADQPLRGWVQDGTVLRMKDEKLASSFKQGELTQDTSIQYTMNDPTWAGWARTVFWNIYREGIPAEERVKELERIF